MRGLQPDTAQRSIALDGVTVLRGGRRVLSEVSVGLDAASIAVIGANGSGKSTFARLLDGLVDPDSGTVSVHGLDVRRNRREIRRRVGFVFTDPQAQILMPTPAEDLAFSLRGRPRDEVALRVAAMLAEHGLTDRADAPASALSGGQKQLLALASVLITGPALIVADEPTTLLDLRNARRIGDLLLSQAAQVVLVTHDLELAARCEAALLFDDGEIAALGEAGDVVAHYRRACE
ncbi:energy-coupling factor ABC transporter ATP-binding protein [Microbacterium hydrocarbonoxydans]|jgi:biotin transport system ATP-binding protein|uniref:energy-coupling factor ABC transporter ATP-binding protein n=1 Tax=Microbacterium hydrocarbonoxydans TaxID=273678 RepID=UPI003D9696BC